MSVGGAVVAGGRWLGMHPEWHWLQLDAGRKLTEREHDQRGRLTRAEERVGRRGAPGGRRPPSWCRLRFTGSPPCVTHASVIGYGAYP